MIYCYSSFSFTFFLSCSSLLLLTLSLSWNENGEIFQKMELGSTELSLILSQPLDTLKVTRDNPNFLNQKWYCVLPLKKMFHFSTNKRQEGFLKRSQNSSQIRFLLSFIWTVILNWREFFIIWKYRQFSDSCMNNYLVFITCAEFMVLMCAVSKFYQSAMMLRPTFF